MAGEMISFPMDATKYTAEDFGFWIGERTRGIYSHKDSDGNEGYFKVAPSASGGMAVTVSDGIAWLKMKDFWGVSSLLKTAAGSTELTLGASDTALNRVDAICVRLNKRTYKSSVIVKAGTPAANPTLPSRVNNDDYDEIYVASVYVGKGAAAITGDNITDLRDNSVYCGYMTDAVVTDAQKLGGVMASGYAKSTSPSINKSLLLLGDGTRKLSLRWSQGGAGDAVYVYITPNGETEQQIVNIAADGNNKHISGLRLSGATAFTFADGLPIKSATATGDLKIQFQYIFRIPGAIIIQMSVYHPSGDGIPDGGLVCTIPSGYRPSKTYTAPARLQKSAGGIVPNGWVQIKSNGQVTVAKNCRYVEFTAIIPSTF